MCAVNELQIDFAGEIYRVVPGEEFIIGRLGDLAIDDNPYLHRHFLSVRHDGRMWWVHNVGTRIPARLSDVNRLTTSTLPPGGAMPLVFESMLLTFHAGQTSYELELSLSSSVFKTVMPADDGLGDTTMGETRFTHSQLLVILALAEPVLSRAGVGAWQIPSAVEAAARLGWTQTRFNRKLDNVCDKLDKAGVKGLRGGVGAQAHSRRANLVDWAVTSRLVTADHLPVLDAEAEQNRRIAQRKEAE